jgi:hypothetical protein
MSYYEKNKEQCKLKSLNNYYRNRDKYLEYQREYFKTYYQLNKEKIKDKCRQYYSNSSEEFKEKRRLYMRKWNKERYIPKCRRNVKKDLTTQLNKTRKTIPKVNRLNNIPVIYNEEGLILLEF